ncbi:hypothetical protein [Bradyrhizobium sp. 150]|nr:hypothetical protein [Bradyrhizobium sp. 150]MCK1671082.1 hypothetical protein [Bradyrhizobium sp. 150]
MVKINSHVKFELDVGTIGTTFRLLYEVQNFEVKIDLYPSEFIELQQALP